MITSYQNFTHASSAINLYLGSDLKLSQYCVVGICSIESALKLILCEEEYENLHVQSVIGILKLIERNLGLLLENMECCPAFTQSQILNRLSFFLKLNA